MTIVIQILFYQVKSNRLELLPLPAGHLLNHVAYCNGLHALLYLLIMSVYNPNSVAIIISAIAHPIYLPTILNSMQSI